MQVGLATTPRTLDYILPHKYTFIGRKKAKVGGEITGIGIRNGTWGKRVPWPTLAYFFNR